MTVSTMTVVWYQDNTYSVAHILYTRINSTYTEQITVSTMTVVWYQENNYGVVHILYTMDYLHRAENCICRGTQLYGVRSILLV
jgi:Gpi18-like mannosyltransferase